MNRCCYLGTGFLHLYPLYFKLHVFWLLSFTPVTYLCKLLGIHSIAAFLQLELFWVLCCVINKFLGPT
ncbi:hypothetical protein DVQ85_09010 [Yersinia enterocolitica]|nr:hypothetical protein [Yersinia enterocolitica]EKN5989453.1 hypothetical protein [Yersinia enterocolitica]